MATLPLYVWSSRPRHGSSRQGCFRTGMKRVWSDASFAVISRLERLQVDLDTISRQVQEVEGAVVRGVVTEEQAGSVLDGLFALANSVGGVEGQARGTSLDHIESGHQEARTLSQRLQQDIADIQQRIARLRRCLDKTASPSASGGSNTEGLLSRQSAYDERLSLTPRAAILSGALGGHGIGNTGPGHGRDAGAAHPPADADLSESDNTSQDGEMGGLGEEGEVDGEGVVVRSDSMEALASETVLYSWGRTDLGCFFLSDVADNQLCEPLPRRSRYSKKNFTCVASVTYHSVGVTGTGEVYGCGVNEDGQVLHDRPEGIIMHPILVEPLLSQRVVQASCGENHTGCLTASGAVVTFGCNEVGQLGHSQGIGGVTRIGPRTMVGLSGKITKQVSCGYLFTVVLASDGMVFSCGVGGSGGHADGQNRFSASAIDALRFVPVSYLATGYSHAVAITVTGQVWAWGQNSQGQLGVEGIQEVQEPLAVPELSNIKMAACGLAHTIYLSVDGQVLACGKNSKGQLGLPPEQHSVVRRPVAIPSLSTTEVIMVAAGESHSLLLTSDKRVLACGSNAAGQLGIGASAEKKAEEKADCHWAPVEVPSLSGRHVYLVAAGGDQSFAICLNPSTAEGGGPPALMDERTMDLVRKFSVTKPATSFVSAPALQLMVEAAARSHNHGQLTRTLVDMFSSANLVNGSFLSNNLSRLDIMGLEAVYCSIIKLGDAHLLQKMMAAFSASLSKMTTTGDTETSTNPSTNATKGVCLTRGMTEPDGLRCLLAYWQCPLNANVALSKDSFIRLCEVLISLPAPSLALLMRWIREDAPTHIFAARLLKPFHEHLTYHLSVEFGRGRAVPTLVILMSYLYKVNEEGPKTLVPMEQFYNEAVSAFPDQTLLQDLFNWKSRRADPTKFMFCSYPFLLSADTKRRLLHAETHIEQQQAAQQDMMRQLLHGVPTISPYLVLRVERAHLLQTALTQIGQLDPTMLKKQLKVIFIGEEGVDEGGVKKEFFQLLIHQLFDFDFGMFRLTESKREIWFNKDCTWSGGEYCLVGVLVGLAIYNATLLDLHFPLAIYRKLLSQPTSLADLEDIDPELMHGLKKLLEHDEEATGGSVQDVFCLSFEVTWTEFDQVRSHELKAGGKEVDVTAANRREYVDRYVHWVLDESIAKQFEEFKNGFNKVMGGSSISLLRPEELELLVCGTPHLDFHELQSVARYEGGYAADTPLVVWFWELVHDMDLESRRKLLMFVTGSTKAPIGGLGKLSILIQRAGPDSSQLPTSHTCFNTLLLPEYPGKKKLHERLMTAINECHGFGLQ